MPTAPSPALHQALLHQLPQAYCLLEVLFNAQGAPQDCRLLETNPAFVALTGLSAVAGRTLCQLRPQADAHWLALLGEVARSGQARHLAQPTRLAGGRWLEVDVLPAGPPAQVAVFFADVTAHQHAEQALRQREAEQDFMLRFSDALRLLSEPGQVQQTACRLLAQRLGAARVNYAEVRGDEYRVEHEYRAPHLASMRGHYAISSFRPQERAAFEVGRTVALADILAEPDLTAAEAAAYSALGVRAFASVPLRKNGQLLCVLSAIRPQPGAWLPAEVAVLEATAERTWAAVERARAEQALRDSEAKYRTLFDSLDEGVTTLEIILDEHARMVDARYLESNPACYALTGLTPAILGKRFSEVVPNLEPFWFDTYARVVHTGQPERHEHAVAEINRWFDIHIARVGGADSRTLVVVYTNITERKQREASVAFLAEASQQLAQLTDVDAALALLGEQLGAQLGLSACAFAELQDEAQTGVINHGWHRADLPDLRGTYRMADFVAPEVLRRCQAGEPVVIRDVWADPLVDGAQYAALGIGSFVSMPLVRDGHWRFLLVVYRSEAYDWRPDELYLLRELTLRIWNRLERARAEQLLRESEEKYRTIFTSMNEGFSLLDVQFNAQGEADDVIIRAVNPAQERIDGVRAQPGSSVRALLPDLEPTWFARYAQVARTGEPAHFEQWSGATQRHYEVKASRVGEAGSSLVAIVYTDITSRRQAAAAAQLRQQLQQQQAQLVAVLEGQEEERRRIAESLHNGIGQLLYATKLRLDLLPPRPTEPGWAEAQQLLAEAIRQTRAVSHELTPALLAEFGLQAALETICRQLHSPGLRWHCHVDLAEAPSLPPVLQQAIYRLVQGLAHNVAKHAQASEVTLEVTARPGWVSMHLEDNGRGFDPATVTEGLGLKTLRSRVALLGGTVHIQSLTGQGTHISVRLPIRAD